MARKRGLWQGEVGRNCTDMEWEVTGQLVHYENSLPGHSHSFPGLNFLLDAMSMIATFFLDLSFSNHRAVFSLEAKFPKCFAQCEKKLSHVSDRKGEGNQDHVTPRTHKPLLSSMHASFSHTPWHASSPISSPGIHPFHSTRGERLLHTHPGDNWRAVWKKIIFQPRDREFLSSGRERMHYNHGREQAFTLLPPSPREVKVLWRLCWWAQSGVFYCRTRSNEAEEMKDKRSKAAKLLSDE